MDSPEILLKLITALVTTLRALACPLYVNHVVATGWDKSCLLYLEINQNKGLNGWNKVH